MAERENIKEFPDIDHKLSAPKKLSEFEKEKKAAEDKKKKEEAENAEALKKFQADFGDDDDDDMNIPPPRAFGGRGGRPPTGPRGRGNFNTGRGGRGSGLAQSGPGSLPPHDFGLPSYTQRQKELNEAREKAQAEEEYMRDNDLLPEDEQEDNAPGVLPNKYQIHLTSIPPYLHIDQVKWILYQHIMIRSIQFPVPGLETEDPRTTYVAVATLEPEITVDQIDQACRELHGSYAGSGLYFGATRQLVGVQPNAEIRDKNGRINYAPYGAKKASEVQFKHDPNRPRPARIPCTCDTCLEQDKKDAADGTDRLPPIVEGPDSLYVEVHPPEDIESVRIIHAVAENFRKGMEEQPMMPIWKEALMMKDPEVYENENYAFLFDRQSRAGTYYMWALLSPDLTDQERFGPYPVLLPGVEDEEYDFWFIPPYGELPFLDLKNINDLTEHRDYDMFEDEEDDGGSNPNPDAIFVPRGSKTFLDPAQWARFVWMMAGLPLKLSDLTKGHIARITNYCIAHADEGADDFVDFILLNVAKPICYTSAAFAQDPEAYEDYVEEVPNGNDEDGAEDTEMTDADVSSGTASGERAEAEQAGNGKIDGEATEEAESNIEDEEEHGENHEDDDDEDDYSKPPYPKRPRVPADHDRSGPKLIALYVVSDLLLAAHNHGCWRYRRIFEDMLVYQKTFAVLGKVPCQLGWTGARSNRWHNQVLQVLEFWAKNNVAHDALETMRDHFLNPYLTDEEREEKAKNKKLAAEEEAAELKKLQDEAKETAQSFDGAADGLDEPEEAAAPAVLSLKPATMAEMPPKRRVRAEDLFGNDDDDDE